MLRNISHAFTKFGIRIQNYGYLLANPNYSKVRKGKGCADLFKLLNKDWFLQQNIKTVLDVGANEGQFITTALALMPFATVYGFEPNPESVKKLRDTDWGSNRINIIPVACGREKSLLNLNVSKFSPSSSLLTVDKQCILEFPETETKYRVEVEVERLDTIVSQLNLAQSPFLLKIDVQGLEMEVLNGAIGVLNQIPVIVCEINLTKLYENQCTFESIVTFMSKYKYQIVDIGTPIRSHHSQKILYMDVAFKREVD